MQMDIGDMATKLFSDVRVKDKNTSQLYVILMNNKVLLLLLGSFKQQHGVKYLSTSTISNISVVKCDMNLIPKSLSRC